MCSIANNIIFWYLLKVIIIICTNHMCNTCPYKYDTITASWLVMLEISKQDGTDLAQGYYSAMLIFFSALAKKNIPRRVKKRGKARRRAKNKIPNFRPLMVSILNISSLSFQMTIILHGKKRKHRDLEHVFLQEKQRGSFFFFCFHVTFVLLVFPREGKCPQLLWELALD